MSYLARIAACHHCDLSSYQAWLIDGQVYGYLTPTFAEHLLRWPQIFACSEQGITFQPDLATYHQRTDSLQPILWQLHQEGVIDKWVGEMYPVTLDFAAPAKFEMERVATLFFGLKAFGVHVNGLVQKVDGVHVWIGTRSLTKPFAPGKLDQMVAGGQPIGISLLDNVIKESEEEAGVPAELARQAQLVGELSYQQTNSRGFKNSTLFIYDLWLPEDFIPENTDGEVSHFALVPLAELARLTETTTQFKENCNLVNIDLLLRQGYITLEHADFAAIHHALYRRFS